MFRLPPSDRSFDSHRKFVEKSHTVALLGAARLQIDCNSFVFRSIIGIAMVEYSEFQYMATNSVSYQNKLFIIKINYFAETRHVPTIRRTHAVLFCI